MDRKLSIPFVLITMGMIESYIYLIYHYGFDKGASNMSTAEVIAICVALISVAGGIWAQVVQFKKDSGTISNIKSDTSEIKPTVNNIDKNVEKVKDEVIEKVVPKMSRLEGIDLLVEDYKYREKLKNEKSVNCSKDILQGSIDLLFAENARLTNEVKVERERNFELEAENRILKDKLRSYERKRDIDRDLSL